MLLDTHIPVRIVLSKIKYELIFISIYATIISILDEYKFANIAIPLALPAILGTAISLLLAFSTNNAGGKHELSGERS